MPLVCTCVCVCVCVYVNMQIYSASAALKLASAAISFLLTILYIKFETKVQNYIPHTESRSYKPEREWE